MKLQLLEDLPEAAAIGGAVENGATGSLLDRVEPVYASLPGWKTSLEGCRNYAELPSPARHYVERIEELIDAPVAVISVGADREQTIIRDELLARCLGE